MPRQPLFAGLVFDEADRPADTAHVGEEPCYVVDDGGFRRHIPSEQTAKMLGQEDVFTRAAIEQQLKNIDKQFDQLLQVGIPEDMRAYLGMIGFKVVINVNGEVIRVEKPG